LRFYAEYGTLYFVIPPDNKKRDILQLSGKNPRIEEKKEYRRRLI